MTQGSWYAQQIIITQAGAVKQLVWVKQLFQLSEIELTEFLCIII